MAEKNGGRVGYEGRRRAKGWFWLVLRCLAACCCSTGCFGKSGKRGKEERRGEGKRGRGHCGGQRERVERREMTGFGLCLSAATVRLWWFHWRGERKREVGWSCKENEKSRVLGMSKV
ncbi:hypothetical protein HAX54_042634 [Datura stramonium]|uniref:Uncharacterized protein n=1 Tax=Datura stramonium TaxID=4076 RepID=A0ABS8RNX0_DATST|nr:hypothetical protein [Datura stramonium]